MRAVLNVRCRSLRRWPRAIVGGTHQSHPASTIGFGIAEVILRNVDISAEASPLPFTIANVTVVPGGRQVVRVHADVDGDGRVSRGDYVSMQSYPVTADTSGRMEIVVREVR